MGLYPWTTLGNRTVVSVVFFVLFAGTQQGTAALITFDYTGVVTEVSGDTSVFDDPIIAGDPFSGSYTFESGASDGAGIEPDPDPINGFYKQDTFPGTSFVVHIGGKTITLPLFSIQVIAADFTTNYNVISAAPGIEGTDPNFPGFFFIFAGFTFYPGNPTLTSDALPTTPPDLSLFSSLRPFALQADEAFRIQGNISSLSLLSLSEVPEPNALMLFAISLCLLATLQQQWTRKQKDSLPV